MAFLERDEEKIGNGFLKNDLSILVSSSDRCTINKSSINYVIKNDNDEMKHYRRKLQLQRKYAKHYTSFKSTFFLLQSCSKYIFWSLLAYFTISSELTEIVIAEGRNIMNRLTTESLVAVLIYNNYSVTTL